MTLYELTEQAQALYELLQADEIDEQTYNDTIEAIGVENKIESYCAVIRQLQGEAELYKAEADRIYKKQKSTQNAVDRLKNSLFMFLKATGQSKAKAGIFNVAVSTSQSVNVTDEKKIPSEYLIEQAPKVDKAGIRKALKDGAVIAGVELVTNEGVRIR